MTADGCWMKFYFEIKFHPTSIFDSTQTYRTFHPTLIFAILDEMLDTFVPCLSFIDSDLGAVNSKGFVSTFQQQGENTSFLLKFTFLLFVGGGGNSKTAIVLIGV